MLEDRIREGTLTRRDFLQMASAALLPSSGLVRLDDIDPEYRNLWSPRNNQRASRRSTGAIILHTTESNDQSARNSVQRGGLANYLVATNGVIYRVIDRDKIAAHAGRSMWDGKRDLSQWSVGIEVVGYHNREPTNRQLDALKDLVGQLKGIYNVPDELVLTHSMVAYGSPNKWHSRSFRGRKRCGMLFAKPDVRRAIGLRDVARSDPDVRAGRLVVADAYLQSVLYGGRQLAATPKETPQAEHLDVTEGIRTLGEDGPTLWSLAGREFDESSTIYFLKDGRVRTGAELSKKELENLPRGTGLLTGYMYGGRITRNRSAYQVVGPDWNNPSTFYYLPNRKLVSGDELTERAIPAGSIVFFQR